MRGVDPLLIDLAARECINVECRCGRIVQLAPYQLIGRNGITTCYARLVVARAVPLRSASAGRQSEMWIEKWRD